LQLTTNVGLSLVAIVGLNLVAVGLLVGLFTLVGRHFLAVVPGVGASAGAIVLVIRLTKGKSEQAKVSGLQGFLITLSILVFGHILALAYVIVFPFRFGAG